MLIGVPKEIKQGEFRVGLTPGSAREYVGHGHDVLVQAGAGAAIGFDDAAYRTAGAKIADTAEEIFTRADMIVKVKEPQSNEWPQLRQGQILYTYLHLAAEPDLTKGLVETGVTAIAYETVTDAHGGLPLLAPMSEVAGRLSIQAAAHCLEMHQGGSGVLIGGVPGVAPARVVVIGGGVVGTHAARMAIGLGAEVTILDRSLPRLRALDDLFNSKVRTLYSTGETLEDEVLSADAVIGAVLVPGAKAPKLVSRDMVSRMKTGSVLVDVAIDQGGAFETSRATTHAEPTFIIDRVVHYCVANMPGAAAATATRSLNNATLAYGLALADHGLDALEDPYLRAGLNTHQGHVTHPAVADAFGMAFWDPGTHRLAA
ncbi:MAG: alanine dehydrogenase [Pseudomonadota bacterium]